MTPLPVTPTSRRNLLRGALLVSGASFLVSRSTAEVVAVTPYIAYTPDSFFKSRVAAAPIDGTRTAAFLKFMTTFPDQRKFTAPTIKGLGTNKWGTAYTVGQATDPIWFLTGTVPKDVAFLKTVGFHAPATFGKQITGTSDSPFVVLDLASGWSVWAAKAVLVGRNLISVGAAGCYEHGSNGLDKRNPKSTSKLNFRSRGAIPDSMVIRRDLVDLGIASGTGLGHVLHMFCTETKTLDGHCHPMVGHESGKNGFGAEGERIFIRADVDLAGRGLTPFGLVIARTLQTHGCYLGDNAGGESTLKAEQTSAAYNPWAGMIATDKCLQGKVTWSDFAVAARGWQ